jgi:hypothetical protein
MGWLHQAICPERDENPWELPSCWIILEVSWMLSIF